MPRFWIVNSSEIGSFLSLSVPLKEVRSFEGGSYWNFPVRIFAYSWRLPLKGEYFETIVIYYKSIILFKEKNYCKPLVSLIGFFLVGNKFPSTKRVSRRHSSFSLSRMSTSAGKISFLLIKMISPTDKSPHVQSR